MLLIQFKQLIDNCCGNKKKCATILRESTNLATGLCRDIIDHTLPCDDCGNKLVKRLKMERLKCIGMVWEWDWKYVSAAIRHAEYNEVRKAIE